MPVNQFISFLFFMLFFPSALFSQHPETGLDPQRSALLCKAFFRGDLKALQPHSSPEMKEAIGNGTLALGVLQISTMFGNRELHIVGLFLDHKNPELCSFLEEMRQNREIRNEAIRRKLNSLGYPLTWDHPALATAGDTASIGRPHFARALMEDYGFPTLQSVFDKLLKRGCPAYVQRTLPDPVRAFDAIHAAGGVSVWAHPVYRERNERAWARRVMKRFAPLGLDAVEGYYSLFGPGETQMMIELAQIYELALSGGSDYHGRNSPNISLGIGAGRLRVPAELLGPLKARIPKNI